MGSLLGGGVCPVVGLRPACPDGGGGGGGRAGLVHPNPYHLPWLRGVTRYSMPMLSLHDQGR